MVSYFDIIPKEVLPMIIENFNVRDLILFTRTSKRFKEYEILIEEFSNKGFPMESQHCESHFILKFNRNLLNRTVNYLYDIKHDLVKGDLIVFGKKSNQNVYNSNTFIYDGLKIIPLYYIAQPKHYT